MSDQPSRPADHALPLSDLALESMPFPMNLYRPDGLIVASNAGVERLFAYPHHRIINTYNLYDDPTTAANGFRAAFERARLGETAAVPPNHFDPTQLGIPGEPIWFTATLFPFAAADGTVAWIGAVYQDVTAQVRAEAERTRLTDELARRAREFQPFYALAENAPDGFVLAGMDQRIIYANRALKAMTRYGEALVGRKIVDLVVGDVDGQMLAMAEALKTTGAWRAGGADGHQRRDRPDDRAPGGGYAAVGHAGQLAGRAALRAGAARDGRGQPAAAGRPGVTAADCSHKRAIMPWQHNQRAWAGTYGDTRGDCRRPHGRP